MLDLGNHLFAVVDAKRFSASILCVLKGGRHLSAPKLKALFRLQASHQIAWLRHRAEPCVTGGRKPETFVERRLQMLKQVCSLRQSLAPSLVCFGHVVRKLRAR
jgi:hypothetical protein